MTPIEVTLLVVYMMAVVGYGRVSGSVVGFVLGFVLVLIIPFLSLLILLRCCIDNTYAAKVRKEYL